MRLNKSFKGYKFPPKVTIETTSIGVYRAVLGMTDRLSLFSRREMEEDKTIGFEAIPYHSSRLQRADGIAIRSDWKPTRIHLEFLERLDALAANRA